MKTTIDIDDKILEQVMKAANVKTKREAVEIALTEFIKKRKREDLIKSLGTFKIDLTQEELEQMRSGD